MDHKKSYGQEGEGEVHAVAMFGMAVRRGRTLEEGFKFRVW